MKRIHAVAFAVLAAISLNTAHASDETRDPEPSSPSISGSAGAPPVPPPMDCRIVIAYDKSRPEWPMTTLPGAGCEAHVEVAIAIVLTALLRSDAATPEPK